MLPSQSAVQTNPFGAELETSLRPSQVRTVQWKLVLKYNRLHRSSE